MLFNQRLYRRRGFNRKSNRWSCCRLSHLLSFGAEFFRNLLESEAAQGDV